MAGMTHRLEMSQLVMRQSAMSQLAMQPQRAR